MAALRTEFALRVGLLLLACFAVLAWPARPAAAVTVNDIDTDGCSDGEELGPSAALGGRRDPESFWDLMDVPTGGALQRDGAVAGADIAAVVQRFASNDTTPGDFDRNSDPLSTPNPAVLPPGARQNYHPAYDRNGTQPGEDPWDLRPPDGTISGGDIGAAVNQFGHRCTNPEVAGAWSAGAPMPTARTEVTAATLDGVIYVIGGFPMSGGHTALVEAYDTGSNTWSTPAPLPQALDHAGAAAVNGKIYVVGGYSTFPSVISSAIYEYDPVAGDWTPRASMPLARAAAATVVVDAKIYVLGGVGPQSTVALVYDPATNMWGQLAPMSAAREHLTASVVDGKIYVIGGRQNVTQNVNTVAVYDPVANAWLPLAPLPTARGGLASGALGGRVHVVGGENLAPGGSTYPQHEVYDPATNSWQPGPPLPTPRHGLAAQVVDGKLYVIGGGPTPGFSMSNAVEIFELKP